MGYGEKSLDLYKKKLPWQKNMQSFAFEFAGSTGFNADLVNYVFECIEYGLGWIKDEPSYNKYEKRDVKQVYAEELTGVDLAKQLSLMKKEYISMLNSLIVVPDGKLYKKSGYYPVQAISELWVIEHKIDIVSAALGQDNSDWCKNEKGKVLARYRKTKSSQFGAVSIKVLLPIIVVCACLAEGGMYVASLKELREYNSFMALGEAAMAKGHNADAIEAFASAEKEYSGVFASGSKKKAAVAKLTEAVTPIFNSTVAAARELMVSGKYADARELLQELETYPFDNTMSLSLEKERQNLEKSIVKAVSDGKNTMLMVISTKGRRLDAKSIETLNELLKVAPDDYWLNFVLNKSK